MEITFTHTGGLRDWVYVLRDDGTPLRWPWPSYGTALPHDLLHYVVETRLGLRRGFWGRLADGGDFAVLSRAWDRIAASAGPDDVDGPDADPGDLTELVQVECVVQAIGAVGAASDAEDCLRAVTERCAQWSVPVPAGLSPAVLGRLQAELADVDRRWRALAAGHSLVLSYGH
ncbi:MAG TPA: hypothetical protein VLJ59_13430 [Mycobacteriales bacterium]|nr:hypothetical protein [Mycobacteriales bacterium]